MTYASAPTAGGNTTVVNPTGEGAVSVSEDAPTPEAANIRLIIPTLSDPSGGTPSSIRIISVTGGSLTQSAGAAITLGAAGTILSLASGRIDLRFVPVANRDTAATFQYVVVDPHNSGVNSAESTATVNITPVNDPPILQTSSGENGDGLYGTYYLNDWQLTGSTSNRVDQTVNFISNVASPNPTTVWGMTGMNPEQYSIRWTGQVKAPVSGTFYFSTVTDDGTRLWINDDLVIDSWIPQAATFYESVGISMTAGTKYNIKFEYYERGGGEQATLQWRYPSQGVQVIPQAYLFPGTSRATLSYVTGAGAVPIDDGIIISDIDSANMASATVSIASNYISGQDYLGFNSQNGISGSFDGTTGVLTLSGSATLANYQTALQSVTYTNTSGSPDMSTRTISFLVNDGSANSNATTRNITITATNNAPVITQGTSSSVTMSEDASPTGFSLTLGATDAENNTLTWSVSGAASHGSASVTGTGNSKSIGYTPVANYNGSDSFLIQVSDGLGGTDTITVNVTISAGNDAPFSTVSPSISGTFHPGQILTANKGTWSDANDQTPGTISYAYEWRRFDDTSGNGLSVVGTNTTYTIQGADLAKYLVLRVTATDDGEGSPSTQSTSFDTDYVQVLNSTPTITEGSAISKTIDEDNSPTTFSQTLTASDSDSDTLTWSVSTPASYGTATLTGSGSSRSVVYEPTANYHGTDSFVVSVTDIFGASATTTFSLTINPINDSPVVTVMPTISQREAVVRVDHTLGVSSGTWNDASDLNPGTITISYQWQRCDLATCTSFSDITGATRATYTLQAVDEGKYIRAQVTATDDGEGLPSSQTVEVSTSSVGQIFPADSSLKINQNSKYTNSDTVGLDVLVGNILAGVTEMSFSEDPLFIGATWVPYSLTARYLLSSGDGQKTVYVRFRDAAGNVSMAYANTIILDTIAELALSKVDTKTYKETPSQIVTTSLKPVLSGTAEPGALINITIHSDPIHGLTYADAYGHWSWTLPVSLPYGTHDARIAMTDSAGNWRELEFNLIVEEAVASTTETAVSLDSDSASDSQNDLSAPNNLATATATSESGRGNISFWWWLLLLIPLFFYYLYRRSRKRL